MHFLRESIFKEIKLISRALSAVEREYYGHRANINGEVSALEREYTGERESERERERERERKKEREGILWRQSQY